MDISQTRFPQELLKIINEIAESHFVAFDLEFSGVAGRRPVGTGKLNLQELYDDTKAAAEKYQILQVGLTIVKEDVKRGRYVARPYNFNISPLTSLRERYFGRVWSHHSGGTITVALLPFELTRHSNFVLDSSWLRLLTSHNSRSSVPLPKRGTTGQISHDSRRGISIQDCRHGAEGRG